ncbi:MULTISPECIES: RNA-binding cell elongation regulator Jag/EloR [Enterococcus]|uniref:RNA-binding protein KhpB n=1 Tax=Enterococcus thailandicus TaxID=417368 RepID=A0A179ESM8_ENTTH|nr:RNA-binding cell elongation regulator Jag/EloR [Enterococcus thailandicus]MDT2751268.1 RNA-binding cell elongation regulator Jag/EloR [Enterococcus thailandicus]MDT2776605.1 RNA-binding cell elongation regulator Jag/EloR [Enterococcus thailandicus]MDT2794688.1 RNA-binding cell elongation regulator Jag/EloR [Enterococcus thailandicus]OAQ55880.1 RNA-binding protein [Enterococcus thailandicus]
MPIYKAATVDEAIQNGLNQLGLTKDQVELEILDEGKKGFLGMGRKDAQVSIEPSVSETISEVVEETVEDVLEETPVEITVIDEFEVESEESSVEQELSDLDDEAALTELALYLTEISKHLDAPALVKMEREASLVVFHLETQKQGILIGKHGKTLNALQYLAQVFIHRVATNKLSIVVNVGNYREKRQEIIQRLAERTADKVIRTGQPVFLEPMPAFERKQIHAALSKNDGVKTHSEGEEPYRYLVVEPAKRFY